MSKANSRKYKDPTLWFYDLWSDDKYEIAIQYPDGTVEYSFNDNGFHKSAASGSNLFDCTDFIFLGVIK